MDFYHRASVNSDAHVVKKSSDSIQLMPIDNSKEAIERFQEIAREAFEQEGYGFKIILQHKSSMYAGGLYDNLILQPTD